MVILLVLRTLLGKVDNRATPSSSSLPPCRLLSSNVPAPPSALGCYFSLLRQRLSPLYTLLRPSFSRRRFSSLYLAHATRHPFLRSFSLPSFPTLSRLPQLASLAPTGTTTPTRRFFTLASSFFPRGVHVEVVRPT